jgi:hypothetical protein
VAKAFLTRDNFKQLWDASKEFMRPLQEPIAEWERIARNRPYPGINPAYPKNTDGTMSAIIQEAPKRIIQQVPSGHVDTNRGDVYDIIADWYLREVIIKNANAQGDMLQKSWGTSSKALTNGSCHTMTYFNGKHADFKIIYIKDVYLEPGKVTFYDSNYVFIRAWYQPSDIDDIIAREESLKAAAKERGEKYKSEWNIPALRRCKDWVSQKETGELNAAEKERNIRSEGIEIIHGIQDGVGAEFLSYAIGPAEFVKTVKNDDPRGVKNVQVEYCDIDFENPLGRGLVERSGGTQNVIDSMLQSYQYNRALMLAPPLIKRGNWNKSQAKLQPNAVIDLGSDPTNTLDTLKLDTTALSNFTNDYGLFKSQIIALNNNGDTSISSEVGNPGFSKTSAGVQAQQLKLGISDNYMRKQYEAWFRDVAESMLNIEFAKKQGVEELHLDKETANSLRKIDPSIVSEDDVYIINFDDWKEPITFEVDATTSDKASKQQQLEAMDAFWERASNNPFIQQILAQYPEKAVEAYNQYLALTGVEDQERLQIDIEQFQADQEAIQQQAVMAQQAQMPVEDPNMPVEGEVMPEQVIAEEPMVEEAVLVDPLEDGVIDNTDLEGLGEEEAQLVLGLQERGIDAEIIAQAIVMLREGVSDEEVAEIVSQALEVEEAI